MFRTVITSTAAVTTLFALAPTAVTHALEPAGDRSAAGTISVDAPDPVATMIPGSYAFHVIERYCLDLPRPGACR